MRLSIGSVLLVILTLASACDPDSRARRNPLDAGNPVTGGRPQNLRAIGNHESVGLSWNQVALSDVIGYRLYRTETDGTVMRTDILGSPPPNDFVDELVANNERYSYQISVLLGSEVTPGESDISSAVNTTPGPETCWIIDEAQGLVLKISADARAVSRQVVSVFGAKHLAVDARDGAAWITTPFGGPEQGGIAARYTVAGAVSAVMSGFRQPGPVAVDPSDGSVWVADAGVGPGDAIVIKATEKGIPLFRLASFEIPSALAVDTASGDCWVGDSATGIVTRISGISDILATAQDMGVPTDIVVNPLAGDAWVIDSAAAAVVRLDGTGNVTARITGLVDPVKLDYSSTADECWIADAGASSVYRIANAVSGNYDVTVSSTRHTTLTELIRPTSVSIDQISGNAWISDPGLTGLLKFSPAGTEIGRFSGLITPVAATVDAGPRSIAFIP